MNNIADKLYNILGTKFNNTDIKTLDSTGKETTDMEEIEMFSFDFLVDSKNYGPVVILLSANDNLEVYYGDNTSKSLDRNAKKKWENLIEHLSTFARSNRLGFSLKHTSDLKYDLSNITDITESYRNIFEGYYGTSKTSYSPQGKAKIIIKHSKAIGEGDKRFRNISQIFIENADGERFKLPFKKLAGARAMARHVTEGGNPYDLFGVHISEMVNDINTLGGFVRRSKMYEGNDEAMGMVETGRSHCTTLRKSLNRIAGKRGYNTYKESWEPSAITEQDTDTTTIRNMFMDKKVNQRTEDALPLLARLQQMAEARGDLEPSEKTSHEEDDMPFNWPEEVKSKEFPGDTHPDSNWTPHDKYDDDESPFPPAGKTPDEAFYETRKKMSDKHQADSFSARTKWKKETDAEEARQKAAFADPKMTWSKYVKGDDNIKEGDARPTEVDIYKKIKDFSLIALKGYARAIKMPRELVDQRGADEDTIIDEIMGYLFDDDWERKLLSTGAFNEEVVTEQYEEQRTAILMDYLHQNQGRGAFDTLTLTSVLAKKGYGLEAYTLDKLLADMERQGLVTRVGTSNLLGSGSTTYNTWELKGQNEMKEVNEFKRWAEQIVEGTWSFPDNPKALDSLEEFMATEQPVGIDAVNATNALYDILGNDDLFDSLAELAADDPDADARVAVKSYIGQMYNDINNYEESDQQTINTLYNVIFGDAASEVEENRDIDYDGTTSQLNASNNSHLDDYIQKEDVDADEYANSNIWNESNDESDSGEKPTDNRGYEDYEDDEDFDKDMKSGYPGDNDDEALSEAALSFAVDGNGPYNVMSSKGDIHDTYDEKEKAQSVAKELNAKHKDTVTESLNALMQRTNFLLRK